MIKTEVNFGKDDDIDVFQIIIFPAIAIMAKLDKLNPGSRLEAARFIPPGPTNPKTKKRSINLVIPKTKGETTFEVLDSDEINPGNKGRVKIR